MKFTHVSFALRTNNGALRGRQAPLEGGVSNVVRARGRHSPSNQKNTSYY